MYILNFFKAVQHYENNRHHPKGYIALLSVILISALGVAIMVSVIASGITSSKTNLSLQQSGSARSIASSCAEEALQKILETGTTTSTSSLVIASGTCLYAIYPTSGNTVTINASGSLGTLTSKIKVVLSSTSPQILLSSWSEVADF
jgi:cytoskeletal protein RodZ